MLRKTIWRFQPWEGTAFDPLDEKSEAVALIEPCCFVILGVDHESIGRDLVPQHAAKGVRPHEFAVSTPLMARIDANRPISVAGTSG